MSSPPSPSSPSSPSAIATQAERAYLLGIYTWIGNGAGCLLGMVPLALPLSVVLTIATLLSGLVAALLGIKAMRAAKASGEQRAIERARWGVWLGVTHVVVVLVVGGALALLWRAGTLGRL